MTREKVALKYSTRKLNELKVPTVAVEGVAFVPFDWVEARFHKNREATQSELVRQLQSEVKSLKKALELTSKNLQQAVESRDSIISQRATALSAIRYGRPALGAKEFDLIRNTNIAETSTADLALQFDVSVRAIEMIRSGTYPTAEFRRYMTDAGLTFGSGHTTNHATVAEAWAPSPPDWVTVLAAECDLIGQSKAAELLGVSAAMVNQALKNRYLGRYDRLKAKVESRWPTGASQTPK